MNLSFSPMRATGVVAIAAAGSDGSLPRHVRVVDVTVAREVRRLALDPGLTRRFPTLDDAARLDALIELAEDPPEPGGHECGGA